MGIFNAAKKIGRFAAGTLGATFGAIYGGPAGAVAGWKAGRKGADLLINTVDGARKAAGVDGDKPKVQEPLPGPPTIDEAARNAQVSSRIRARRGVLANIYGGSTGSTPALGTKTLLGS